MEPIQITYEWLQPYWDAKKFHKNYINALDVYHHVSFHFDGYFQKPIVSQITGQVGSMPQFVNPYFSRLIDQRRPGESDTILAYRRATYLPVTKVPCGKVVNCLKKIIKSSDWKIDYSKTEIPNFLSDSEGNTLYDYCEKSFPKDDSIENWAYKNIVAWMLKDPNAVICVMPLSWEVEANELLCPYPHIICCKDVYDFKEGQYCVFLSPYVTQYLDRDGNKRTGKILMVVTPDSYWEAKEIGDNKFELVQHIHNIGTMPAWVMGGESKSPDPYSPFYESFIMPMLPSLDAAAADVSDLQAEKVQHLFSTMWVVQMQSCANCQGTGNVIADGKQSICPSCEGRGNMPFSPLRTIEINPNSALRPDVNIPNPPAGYLTKPTEMVKLMMEIIRSEQNDALAAINLENLMESPLDQSGISKAYDEQETNNFVYSIAYHLVNEIIVPIYYYTNELRYMGLVADSKTRKKMLPTVNTPERFDFLVQVGAVDDLIKITTPTAGVSEEIVDAAEMSYVHQEFQDAPDVISKLKIIHDHNPLRNRSVDEINALVKSALVTKEDAVLAINIGAFVTQILNEDSESFMAMDFADQHEILIEMAEEKVQALESAEQIRQQAIMAQKVDAEGNPVAAVGTKQKQAVPGQKPRKKDRNDLTFS